MKIRGLQTAVRKHVEKAVSRLGPIRYRQEAAYVAALFARLDGVVLDRLDARAEFRSTVVADRGPESAESIWGADFGLAASLTDDGNTSEKGILGQAKRHDLTTLRTREGNEFREQVAKMGRATLYTVGLEVPNEAGAMPRIRIVSATYHYIPDRRVFVQTEVAANLREKYEHVILPTAGIGSGAELDHPEPAVLVYPAVPLDHFLSRYFIGCIHGDHRSNFVSALNDSNLTRLQVLARKGR